MNKGELVSAVAKKADVPKEAAGKSVDAVFATITETLKEGDSLTLVGFGTFQVKERSAREGRNPRTGELIKIAPATVPVFKPGKNLKDAVNIKKAKQ